MKRKVCHVLICCLSIFAVACNRTNENSIHEEVEAIIFDFKQAQFALNHNDLPDTKKYEQDIKHYVTDDVFEQMKKNRTMELPLTVAVRYNMDINPEISDVQVEEKQNIKSIWIIPLRWSYLIRIRKLMKNYNFLASHLWKKLMECGKSAAITTTQIFSKNSFKLSRGVKCRFTRCELQPVIGNG
ncbi:hypothetical protein [Cohnella sp.]|uniref:hypothetical protein n=1 Tax=Cohnella sp. TaxID=1883426 RepID=UPI0035676BE3